MAGVYANETTYGVDFTKLVAGTPTYVAIGELVSVAVGGITADSLDTTVHGDEWRTRISGLKDAGTLDLTLRFMPESHAALLDNVGTLCAHRVVFPKEDSTNLQALTMEFDGFISNLGVTSPHDGLLEATLTVQLSGAPVIDDEAAT